MISKFKTRTRLLTVGVLLALLALAVLPVNAGGFVHGIVINVDGDDYYMEGAPDGPGGAFDIPGHYWVQAGPDQMGPQFLPMTKERPSRSLFCYIGSILALV